MLRTIKESKSSFIDSNSQDDIVNDIIHFDVDYLCRHQVKTQKKMKW